MHIFLYVEPEQYHIAVLHDIFLAFGADQTLFAGSGHRSVCDQILIGDNLGPDEATLEIGMNFASGLRRLGTAGDGQARTSGCPAVR